jgi:hypothetical protein
MPGPLKKTTENETLVIPVLENAPELRVRPPASNTTDTTTNAPPADDGLFIRNGGMDRDKL